MHIFLTGASGLVGSVFAKAATRRGHKVTGTIGTSLLGLSGVATRIPLDLTQEHAVIESILEVFPDVIVNCAAIAEPAKCEADPILSQKLNVTLPALLARLANHVSARFIHISSEQVFDGQNPPYAPDSKPCPINLYGQQKLESERAVHANAPAFAVTIRAPLLTGNSASGLRSLHERLFADWSQGKTPRLFTDEIRQPCSAENLAEVMLELCERQDVLGLGHWAGAETLSRFDLAHRIRRHFKLSEEAAPIQPISRTEDPLAVQSRPANLALITKPLAGLLKTPVETFDAQLELMNVPPPFRKWYFSV